MKNIKKDSWANGDWSVLFQNKNWSIELSKDKQELHVTNGFWVINAYYDRDKDVLRYDHIWHPPYIQRLALKLAKKHMVIFDKQFTSDKYYI